MKKALKIVLEILILAILLALLYLGVRNFVSKKNTIDSNPNIVKNETNNKYAKLEELPKDYTIEQAINDGCFVITYGKIYNYDRMNEFIRNTKMNAEDRKEDIVRIVQSTVEGDIIISDLSYEIKDETYMLNGKEINKSTYVLKKDSTRDKFSATEDRIIRTNDDIPGDIYTVAETKENGMVSINLELVAEIMYSNENVKQYKNINVCNYSSSSEKVENTKFANIKAVVIRVNEHSLDAMGIESNIDIFSVGFADEGNIGFKQGQEISIDFNGMIMETYPAQLGQTYKIEIVKEKSDIEIPDKYLKFYFSSKDNVKVTVNDINNQGITISISDTNELPYEYYPSYTLQQKIKNKDYTGVGEKIGEDTENSVAGFTGTGSEYIWEEVKKISNITSEETAESLVYNLPAIKEGEHLKVVGWKFDWTKLYGKLGEGEYYFNLKTENLLGIRIKFVIDANGKVSYDEPNID